jgi:hypothetical protein
MPGFEHSLLWNDSRLGIAWPMQQAPTLAARMRLEPRWRSLTYPRRRRDSADGSAGSGFELARVLPAHGRVIAMDRAALDLADAGAVIAAVRDAQPQLIVNAGAYTAVDRASELRRTDQLAALRHLAGETRRADAVLIVR